MRRLVFVLSAVFLAVSTATTVFARTDTVSIPAWIGADNCSSSLNLEATLNGKPAPITGQLGPNSDQIILIVFDLSSDYSRAAAAKEAVISEISKLPSNVWVGMLRTEDGLHVLADPTAKRKPVISEIHSLTTSSETGFLGTVQSALSLADAMVRASPVRVSVLYITDGSIYGYREDYTNPVINASDPHDLSRRFPGALIEAKISSLAHHIESLQAPLFVIHLKYRQDQFDQVYQSGIDNLVKITGGEAAFCHSVAEVPDTTDTIFARILKSWRLNLVVPPKLHKTLQIRLTARCHGGNVQLSYRPYLYWKGGTR